MEMKVETKLDWSPLNSILLIREYSNHRALWDPKDSGYFHKAKKQEEWESVAAKFQVNVDEIKRKMGTLLGSYRRERSKINRGMKSVWFGYQHFAFLKGRSVRSGGPRMELADLKLETGNDFSGPCWVPSDMEFDITYSEEDNSELGNVLEYDNTATQESGSFYVEDDDSNEVAVEPETIIDSTSMSPIAKRLKLETQNNEILERSTISTFADDCSVYGQHVSNKLRVYPNRTRVLVEHAINNILFEADMGKYDIGSCCSGVQCKCHSEDCRVGALLGPVKEKRKLNED